MEFRIEKGIGAIFIGMALLAPAAFAQDLRYDVWHGHSRVYSMPPHIKKAGVLGTLTVNDLGVSFEQKYEKGKKPKHPQVWHWEYPDIQQLKISAKTLSVLTHKDNKWKFGADREYDFDLVSDNTFENAYNILKTRLDQRFVAAIADSPSTMLWEIPAKHLVGFGGDEGVLQVGISEIVYKSAKRAESRSWRYETSTTLAARGPLSLRSPLSRGQSWIMATGDNSISRSSSGWKRPNTTSFGYGRTDRRD